MSTPKVSRPATVKSTKTSTKLIDWQFELDKYQINSDRWQCQIGHVVEFNSTHTAFVDALKRGADKNFRPVVKVISLDSLATIVQQYAFDVQNNLQSVGLNNAILTYPLACAEVWSIWSTDGIDAVPNELLAKLIKYEVLRLKYNYLYWLYEQKHIQETINEEFENILMGVRKPCVIPCQDVDKSITPNTRQIQISTKLKKRGEKSPNFDSLIDDAPLGGANFYILLVDFNNLNLLIELIKLKMPILSLIQMRRSTNEQLDTYVKCGAKLTPTTIRNNKIVTFWKEYAQLTENPDQYKLFENVPLINFKTPEFEWSNSDAEQIEHLIFEQFSYCMYDINDIYRQYVNFIQNMKIIKTEDAESAIKLVEMTEYNRHLNKIPCECCSVPIILDAILQEASKLLVENVETTDIVVSTVPNKLDTSPNLDESYTAKFLDMFEEICQQHNYMLPETIDNNESARELRQPQTEVIIIQYGNEVHQKFAHLMDLGINLENITLNVLSNHFIPHIWKHIPKITETDILNYKQHFSKLFDVETSLKDVNPELFCHKLHARIFETLAYLSPVDKQFKLSNTTSKTSIETSPTISIIDILNCRTFSDLLNYFDEKIDNCEKEEQSLTANFETVEFLDLSPMLQQLYKASTTFICIEYGHFSYTDVFLVHFHNGHVENNRTAKWQVHIPTAVCFRDFISYVLKEHSEWIHNEEIKYFELCKINEKFNDSNSALHVEIKDNSLKPQELDYLIPGSIKYQQYQVKQLSQSQKVKVESQKNTNKSQKLPQKSLGTKKKPPTAKKMGVSPNVQITLEQLEIDLCPEIPETSPYARKPLKTADNPEDYTFLGYDLGNTRVQFDGTTADIFSKEDQSAIRIDKVKSWEQIQLLSVEVSKRGHSLFLHSYVKNSPLMPDEPFVFHVNAANGMILSFSPNVQNVQSASKQEFIDTIVDNTRKSQIQIISKTQHAPIDEIDSFTSIEQSEIDNKMKIRMEKERKFYEKLLPIQILAPNAVKASNMLLNNQTEILQILNEARKKYYPCYKICSSKLHMHKYLKRIKPRTTINVVGVIKGLSKLSAVAGDKAKNKDEKMSKEQTSAAIQKQSGGFDFKCSLPNGLRIQSVSTATDCNYDPFYIKQDYLTHTIPNTDELSRCFLRNGMILIFKRNNIFKILCSNTTMFYCETSSATSDDVEISKRKQHQKDGESSTFIKKFKSIMKRRINRHLITDAPPRLPRIPSSRHLNRKHAKKCFKFNSTSELKRLAPILKYTVISANGTKTTVRNKQVSQCHSKLLVETHVDIINSEICTYRDDNTTMLCTKDGGLVTCFADGTRITTNFEIEPDDKDGFVSVILNCTFEHPNYVTVTYKGSNLNCHLETVDNVRVKICSNQSYLVELDPNTQIKLNNEMILFTQNVCEICKLTNSTSINITPFTTSPHWELHPNGGIDYFYITHKDVLNQIINIDYEGNILYEHERPRTLTKGQMLHGNSCPKAKERQISDMYERFFVLNRDLTGYEFINTDEKIKFIDMSRNKSNFKIEQGPKHNCLTIMYDLDSVFGAQKHHILPSFQKPPKIPSTYFPIDWLTPFSIVPKNVSRQEQPEKNVLSIKLIRKFIDLNENTLSYISKSNQIESQTKIMGAEKAKTLFKDRWNMRNEKLALYQEIIRNKTTLKYFSRETEQILFEKTSDSTKDTDFYTRRPIKFVCDKSYTPNLNWLQREWNKINYYKDQLLHAEQFLPTKKTQLKSLPSYKKHNTNYAIISKDRIDSCEKIVNDLEASKFEMKINKKAKTERDFTILKCITKKYFIEEIFNTYNVTGARPYMRKFDNLK